MANEKILLVEDDFALAMGTEYTLKTENYEVVKASNLAEAKALLQPDIDLVLLDVMLPDGNGYDFCRHIREHDNYVPVIFLTAVSDEVNLVQGLELGADDYIAKPYNAQILLARIQKLLARTYEVQDNIVLTYKGLTLNLLKAEISYQGNKKSLTKNELGILRLLMVNKGNIIPRDAIIDELWQSEQFIDENTLNVNIVRLRKALTEIGLPDYLETKRGLGYCV
mgnify:CR=1 FL=1